MQERPCPALVRRLVERAAVSGRDGVGHIFPDHPGLEAADVVRDLEGRCRHRRGDTAGLTHLSGKQVVGKPQFPLLGAEVDLLPLRLMEHPGTAMAPGCCRQRKHR